MFSISGRLFVYSDGSFNFNGTRLMNTCGISCAANSVWQWPINMLTGSSSSARSGSNSELTRGTFRWHLYWTETRLPRQKKRNDQILWWRPGLCSQRREWTPLPLATLRYVMEKLKLTMKLLRFAPFALIYVFNARWGLQWFKVFLIQKIFSVWCSWMQSNAK